MKKSTGLHNLSFQISEQRKRNEKESKKINEI